MTNLVTEDSLQSLKSSATFMPTKEFELSEEYLTRRFARPEKRSNKVVYEVTRDPGLLHQYYRLREQMFINVWGLKQFSGQKDEFDDKCDVMIARIGNHCIGGCRLSFSKQGEKLPMEKDGLALADLVPELPLDDMMYVEVSRMAILPDYQNTLVMLELSRQLLKRAASMKARYAFTLAPVPLARNYRKAAHLFGLKWMIRNDVAIPDREEYEGIKMVLSQLDLGPAYTRKPKGKQAVIEEPALLLAD